MKRSDFDTVQNDYTLRLSRLEKEVLLVTDIAILLGSSKGMVYKLINSGILNAAKLGPRKTVVLRSDFLSFFNKEMWVDNFMEPMTFVRKISIKRKRIATRY